MISVVFLGPKANAELVPKFHVTLHASLSNVRSKFYYSAALPTLISMQVSSHSKVHFPSLYLLHFLRVHPFSNVALQEGLRAQREKFQSTKIVVPPSKM
jgi:hypothetical protein